VHGPTWIVWAKLTPFSLQDLGGSGWNSQGIGSVAGGLAIVGPDKQHERLRMFFSSGSVGIASLRCD
jgi:hypothetical protein